MCCVIHLPDVNKATATVDLFGSKALHWCAWRMSLIPAAVQGSGAKLNDIGYKMVSSLKDEREMADFVQRVVLDMEGEMLYTDGALRFAQKHISTQPEEAGLSYLRSRNSTKKPFKNILG